MDNAGKKRDKSLAMLYGMDNASHHHQDEQIKLTDKQANSALGSPKVVASNREIGGRFQYYLTNGVRLFFALMLIFNPISKAFSSIAEIGALVCLIGLLSFKTSRVVVWSRWRAQPLLKYFLWFFLIHCLGLLYTSDMKQGLWDLNMRHYWLVLPLFGTAVDWPRKWLNNTLLLLVLANLYICACVIFTLTTGISIDGSTLHDLSPYVQRPRASLMMAGAVVCSIYLFKQTDQMLNRLFLASISIILCFGILVLGGRVGQLGLTLVAPLIIIFLNPLVFNNNFKKVGLIVGCFLVLLIGYFAVPQFKAGVDQVGTEVEEYRNGFQNSWPAFSSVGKRFHYYEQYAKLFMRYPLFGVGTGDLPSQAEPLFDERMYHIVYDRPHNEAVEVVIKFGVVGLLLWLVMMTKLGIALARGYNKALGLSLFLLIAVSMLTDATSNTQAGAIFSLGFIGLLLSVPKADGEAFKT